MGTWGMFNGVQNAPMEALFADSIPLGKRSEWMTKKYIINQTSNGAGPLLGLIMFLFIGNEWSVKECLYVMSVGLAINFLAVFLNFFFSDDLALPNEKMEGEEPSETEDKADLEQGNVNVKSEDKDLKERINSNLNVSPSKAKVTSEENDVKNHDSDHNDDSTGDDDNTLDLHKPLLEKSENSPLENMHSSEKSCCLSCGKFCRFIPAVVAISDVGFGLASGMSIKFFPIFFQENCNLSPAWTSAIYAVSPCVTSLISYFAQWLSLSWGRIPSTLTLKSAGVALLIIICRLTTRRSFMENEVLRNWTLAIIFIFRTGLMNACKPLTRSVIMDNVPKSDRAKWSSLESVNMATWAGSAVLGGYIVDTFDIVDNFFVTAIAQGVSLLPLFLLLGKVKEEVKKGNKKKILTQTRTKDKIVYKSIPS